MSHSRVPDEDVDRLEVKLRQLGFGGREFSWPISYIRSDMETFELFRKVIDKLLSAQSDVSNLSSHYERNAECPCCEESVTCDEECTFATDCPENFQLMLFAREILKEVTRV